MKKVFGLFLALVCCAPAINANEFSKAALAMDGTLTPVDAYEQIMVEYESLEQQFTQVYNTTVNAEEYKAEKYAAVIEEMTPVLNGIQQNMTQLKIWAEESLDKGTIVAEMDEILSNFEGIQVQLTQFLNTFNGAIKEVDNNAAVEAFQAEYESLSQQFTQVYNTTVNAEEYKAEKYASVIEEMTPVLNSIQQNMATLQTWAEESMQAGTLAADLDEILASFEGIQVQLTQFLNTFNGAIKEVDNNLAAEAFMAEYESLSQQFTMVYNTTVNAEKYQDEKYASFIEAQTTVLNAIQQNMATLQTWAEESMAAGTLAADLDEILASFEGIQLQLTQFLNSFNEAVKEVDNNLAAEAFMAEYENLSQQFTMVYNTTVNAEKYQDEAYASVIEQMTPVLNSIQQNMATLQTWAEESMQAGTLAADLDEILGSFEQIQIQLTQFLNTFNGAIKEVDNNLAAEAFMAEYESLSQQFTMVYNTTVNAAEYQVEKYASVIEEMTPVLNSIQQNMATLQTWAQESMAAGTLADDLDEILASFEGIQQQLTQFLNTFNGAIKEVDNNAAAEAFMAEYESLSQQFTMVYNTTVNAAEYQVEKYASVIEEMTPVLNSIQQNMATLQTWAQESMEAGTLADDLDEILASFEGIQQQLTQFLNTFNGAIKEVDNNAAAEAFMAEYESLSQQFTQVYNTTVNAEKYQNEKYASFIEAQTTVLNAIQQNMATLQTWAEESMAAGTLADDLDEILASFEGIQLQLTQFLNSFNEAAAEYDNNLAAEAFMAEYESLSQQFTQVYNTTVNAERFQDEKYAAVIEEMTPVLNSIQQNMATLQTWAEESMQAGTLAADLDEILGSFEQIQIQLTQFYNTFMDKIAEIDPAEAFMAEYESLSQQFTQVYNTTVNAEKYQDEKYAAVIEQMTPVLNAIQQNMAQLQTWAEESMAAGTLAADLDEILSNFEGIQIQLTQFLNTFNDAIKEVDNNAAAEAFMAEYESLQQQFTQVYNSTINAAEYQDEKYASVIEEMTPVLNSIQQNMATLQTWAEESMGKGTLADDLDEILASFEGIQQQLTQFLNSFNEAIKEVDNNAAAEAFMAEYESLQQQFTMVYNSTVNAEEYQDEKYASVIEEMTPVLNSIQQNMATLQTWAEESMQAGTLAADLDEILASFEGIQQQLTQFYNTFMEKVNALPTGIENIRSNESLENAYLLNGARANKNAKGIVIINGKKVLRK